MPSHVSVLRKEFKMPDSIVMSDPLREVYLLETPDGSKHFCPKWLRNYRNAGSGFPTTIRNRVVKIDLVNFEDAAKTKKKLVVPIIHALMVGHNQVFVTYLILTPDPKAATSMMPLGKYQKLPEMEIEGI